MRVAEKERETFTRECARALVQKSDNKNGFEISWSVSGWKIYQRVPFSLVETAERSGLTPNFCRNCFLKNCEKDELVRVKVYTFCKEKANILNLV